ncbi:MAG: hypothetical protein ACREJ2_08955 [Planctomycetota bacterium]
MQARSRIILVAAAAVALGVAVLTAAAFAVAPALDAGGTAGGPDIIGGPGTAPGRFFRPRGLTSDAAGDIYNVDQTGHIQVFSPAGKVLRDWMMPAVSVGKPEGLAIDLDGNLLVADTHYSRVIRFSPEGQELKRWGHYGVGPGQFTYPLAVAVDRNSGRIYVSEYGQNNDRVQIFTRDGEYLKGWGSFGTAPGQFRRPSGLAIGPDGNIYVADAVNHRVQVFTSEGIFVRTWGHFGSGVGELEYPYDVAVSPANVVFVCEFGNNRIQAFTPLGQSLGWVGGTGARPGQLATPWCVTLEPKPAGDGKIDWWVVVADTVNQRLCRWPVADVLKQGAQVLARQSGAAGTAAATATAGRRPRAGSPSGGPR